MEKPPGIADRNINTVDRQLDTQDDDDYFHLACHVDSTMKQRIERGEFVDLDKLLPKKRGGNNDEGRLEWISKDGMTFLAPAQDSKDTKINGIRRWEQAFRVYAAIYCSANPARTTEIWQYIYTITSAASSYQWDNVAYYDYTFRQMMGELPFRSWSKTYAQLWQLALRDPLPKGGNGSESATSSNSNNPGHQLAQQNNKGKSWHDRCCWKYNRFGNCNLTNCPFDNRCKHCGGWNHGFNTCRKHEGNTSSGSGGAGTSNQSNHKK